MLQCWLKIGALYLITTWEKGNIKISGVSGQIEQINQVSVKTEIIIGNKIIKIYCLR